MSCENITNLISEGWKSPDEIKKRLEPLISDLRTRLFARQDEAVRFFALVNEARQLLPADSEQAIPQS